MIAAAIVCAAAMSQAASYTWKAASSYTYLPETTTKVDGATAYLFNALAYSQDDLVDYFAANKTLNTGAAISTAPTGAMEGGQVKLSDSFTYNQAAGVTQWDAYFAMVVDGKLYVSSAKTTAVPELSDAQPIAFGSQSTPSKAAAKLASAGYDGAGWYTAVPEPTSGLLLLLGVAGLALRRRRA